MDNPKDIYHKEAPSIPSRRKWRQDSDASRSQQTTPGTVPATQPIGTQSLGVPISPVQIARQQLQMQPQRFRRRRRHHRTSEHGSRRANRLIWMLVGLVIIAYVAILSLSILKARGKQTPAQKAIAAATTLAQHSVTTNATQQSPAENGLPIAERVQKWTKGAHLLDESESLLNSGRYPQAREKLVQAGALIPQSVEQMSGMARVYLSEKNYPEAEKMLVRVVEAAPGQASARAMLARALLENGKFADALAVAEWICSTDPYSEDGHDVAATAALSPQINDMAKAIEHLKKLANLRTDDYVVKNSLGKAYLRTGDLVNARKVFDDILRADGANSAAYYNLAVCLTKQDKPNEAIATLSRAAIKLGESFVAAWLNSSDFDAIRSNADFLALQKRLASVPSPATSAIRPPPEKTAP